MSQGPRTVLLGPGVGPGPASGRAGAELAEIKWAYESACYEALGHRFSFRTTDPCLGRYLESLFRHFSPSTPVDGAVQYSLAVEKHPGQVPFALYRDEEPIAMYRRGADLLARLLWHINQAVIQETTDHLLIHASAAAWDGKTLVFPAPMESGKTTLVAGLVRAGFGYVTDEAVAIDPSSLMVTAFPRALSIDPGSWDVLSDLRPKLDPEIEPYQGDQWQVPPDSIRSGAVVLRSNPRFVIMPRYGEGIETKLEPMPRSEAVRVMGDNAFNFQSLGAHGLRVLAEVARRSSCYRLDIGHLDEACELVRDLVGTGPADEGRKGKA